MLLQSYLAPLTALLDCLWTGDVIGEQHFVRHRPLTGHGAQDAGKGFRPIVRVDDRPEFERGTYDYFRSSSRASRTIA